MRKCLILTINVENTGRTGYDALLIEGLFVVWGLAIIMSEKRRLANILQVEDGGE